MGSPQGQTGEQKPREKRDKGAQPKIRKRNLPDPGEAQGLEGGGDRRGGPPRKKPGKPAREESGRGEKQGDRGFRQGHGRGVADLRHSHG